MRPEIRSISTVTETHFGYAVTGVFHPGQKSQTPLKGVITRSYRGIPTPRMVVLHDFDYPATIGSYWGEIQGNIALAWVVGPVTDGGVRDLRKQKKWGFFLGKEVLVSHGYVHAVAYNVPWM
ncbi:MAG: hypothetical protein CM1200mP39_06000 [Dehalococcoidia bacterium]|nr:MAG: hypothetical protein CM1200mP39_06000 [Dehalococcoidia bacterium]